MRKAIKVDLITDNICLEDNTDTYFINEMANDSVFSIVAEKEVPKAYKIYRIRRIDGKIVNYLLQQSDSEIFNDLVQISNNELESVKRTYADKKIKELVDSGRYIAVELSDDLLSRRLSKIKNMHWWKRLLNKF